MLYKYAPYDRRDILEHGIIRFTQPGAFNDPFELHPSFDLMSKTDIARLPEAPGQEGQSGPKARQLTPEVMQAMMSALMPGIQRTIAATVQGEGFFSLNNNQIARSVFDSKFGVLSLTESPDGLLMWAHYADCHRGLALQLDETHEFFAPRVFEGQELSLTKVEYTDEQPLFLGARSNALSSRPLVDHPITGRPVRPDGTCCESPSFLSFYCGVSSCPPSAEERGFMFVGKTRHDPERGELLPRRAA